MFGGRREGRRLRRCCSVVLGVSFLALRVYNIVSWVMAWDGSSWVMGSSILRARFGCDEVAIYSLFGPWSWSLCCFRIEALGFVRLIVSVWGFGRRWRV